MKSKLVISVMVVALGATMLAGCAKAPETALADAEQAMAEARAADAATYAPEALQAATLAQEDLTRELEAQKGRFALLRKYGEAETLALQATTAAREAAARAATGKTQARDAAQASMTQTQQLLTEVRDLLAAAPRGKGSEADLQALTTDLQSVEAALVQAQTEFAAEKYRDAATRAEAGKMTAMSVKQAVEQAQQMAGTPGGAGTPRKSSSR